MPRMNTAFRLAIIVSLVVFGNACQTLAADSANVTNSSVGAYICDEAKIHLVIKSDGTYSMDRLDPRLTAGSGIWEAKGEEIILQRRSGGIGFSIRQLDPIRKIYGRLLWIFPASHVGGAITYPIFHRETR